MPDPSVQPIIEVSRKRVNIMPGGKVPLHIRAAYLVPFFL